MTALCYHTAEPTDGEWIGIEAGEAATLDSFILLRAEGRRMIGRIRALLQPSGDVRGPAILCEARNVLWL